MVRSYIKIHEITLADKALNTIRGPQKRGRVRSRPKSWAADGAYDRRTFRTELRWRGIRAVILTFERCWGKKLKRGHPIQVGAEYKTRWEVERSFAWMDNCRRLAVRWERSLHLCEAFCWVALILWGANGT